MHAYLGEKVFRTGVANYIHKHRYANAEQDDLWESLTEEAHKEGSLPKCLSVKQVMDTWTVQTGYPLVTVTRHYEDDSDVDGMATVTQNRYFSDPTLSDQKSCWYVPLTYTTQQSPNFTDTSTKKWMMCDGQETRLANLGSKDQWVIFNIGLKGKSLSRPHQPLGYFAWSENPYHIHAWISKNLQLFVWISMIFGCQSSILHTSVDVHI